MPCWCLHGAAFLPSILVIWSSAGFLFSYIISVLIGHVPPFVPYISDTGTSPPESGVFGFMISLSAMLGAATMYTRYKILEKQNHSTDFLPYYFNKTSLAIGLLGCIGMGIVATFQEMAVPAVHDAGALITFICGVLYILLQSYISYKSCPAWNTRVTCHIRMAISVIAFIAVVPMIACSLQTGTTKLYWKPSDEGYHYHLTSAICEWIVAFGFNMYFLTFIRDFQGVSIQISTEIHEDF
ncbi:DNA damage-regulated autophagy modulator protein 1 isoform X1 [Xenopus tropicalis]|uniref:DNA damage-regulated autophagy modulator protein 1 n=1 Tax=Xenopus tropicalis TaxID=8364 RepID=A0A6I8RUT3_XENTR|nr:DNA damage-regulated autophagy modulator protein 1 isoform X1 [Xenopus tropicalis]|eukprot:XP_012814426.1 PREDICTED: DNA damage-regulated autophagy modulator protein 1 isoform X1 [Xenopus tropicalis]